MSDRYEIVTPNGAVKISFDNGKSIENLSINKVVSLLNSYDRKCSISEVYISELTEKIECLEIELLLKMIEN